MYTFKHKITHKLYRYKTIAAALRAKDKLDTAYGAIITTYPVWSE